MFLIKKAKAFRVRCCSSLYIHWRAQNSPFHLSHSPVLLLVLKCTKAAALTFTFLKSSSTIHIRVKKNRIYLETHFADISVRINTDYLCHLFQKKCSFSTPLKSHKAECYVRTPLFSCFDTFTVYICGIFTSSQQGPCRHPVHVFPRATQGSCGR